MLNNTETETERDSPSVSSLSAMVYNPTVRRMDSFRKTATLVGFFFLLITGVLEYLIVKSQSVGQLLLMQAVAVPFFAAGIYNTYHPLKGRMKYPFLAIFAPIAVIAGFISGTLLYTYPLGVAFAILWIYAGIGVPWRSALWVNIVILCIYTFLDFALIHYSLEYRLFNLTFLLGISVLSFLTAYTQQSVMKELDVQFCKAVETAEALEKELQGKTQMYTSFAHEIKTPLTIIRHYFLRYRQKSEDTKELRILQDNLDRLERQMVSLLKFEREMFFADDTTVNDEEEGVCNFSILLEKNIPLLESYFERKNISLVSAIEPGISVCLNQVDCEHIYFNLLENALRYTERGGEVSIFLTAVNSDQALLKVADNGIGIEPAAIGKIFDPYVQSHKILSSKQGLGLGLTIVKRIITHAKGTLQVNSEVGKGTEFQIFLPRTELIGEEGNVDQILPFLSGSPKNRDESKNKEQESNITGSSIFVVEDDEELCDFLEEFLSKDFRVSAFQRGADALRDIHHRNIPKLIVSDVYMTEMSGLTLMESVIDQFPDIHIPFIFISADDTEQMRLRGLGKGALDYIVKPFSPEELKTKILTWLSLISELKEDDFTLMENLVNEYRLSSREEQIAMLMAKGLPRKEISNQLFISMNTVKTHIASIYLKCAVKNRSEFLAKIGR